MYFHRSSPNNNFPFWTRSFPSSATQVPGQLSQPSGRSLEFSNFFVPTNQELNRSLDSINFPNSSNTSANSRIPQPPVNINFGFPNQSPGRSNEITGDAMQLPYPSNLPPPGYIPPYGQMGVHMNLPTAHFSACPCGIHNTTAFAQTNLPSLISPPGVSLIGIGSVPTYSLSTMFDRVLRHHRELECIIATPGVWTRITTKRRHQRVKRSKSRKPDITHLKLDNPKTDQNELVNIVPPAAEPTAAFHIEAQPFREIEKPKLSNIVFGGSAVSFGSDQLDRAANVMHKEYCNAMMQIAAMSEIRRAACIRSTEAAMKELTTLSELDDEEIIVRDSFTNDLLLVGTNSEIPKNRNGGHLQEVTD
ncbi:hypothetical protein HK096_007586, partial [Nowakowskiella sp. JEL0078]